MTHVLVVNARKIEPVELLRQDPTVRISVITEAGLEGLYQGVGPVTTVDDLADLKQVREAALRVIASEGTVDAVLAPSERSMPTGGFLRSYLGLPGLSFDVANLCCNKFAMKARLREHGIPVAAGLLAPAVADLRHAAARLGHPVVVKPAFGAGSTFTFVARTGADLDEGRLAPRLAGARPPFVVEKLVDVADEYHCDGVVVDGKIEFAAVARYFEPVIRSMDTLFGSHTLPAGTPEAEAVLDLHRRTVAALGLRDGVTHMELFRTTTGEFVVGEIAGRPGGGGVPDQLRHKYGIDTGQLFLDAALGRPLRPRPDEQDGVLVWCRLPLRGGRVVQVSGPEDFADIPEIFHTEITVAAGDLITGTLFSTSMAGMLLCRTRSTEDVPGLLDRIRERFTIQIEQEES